MRCSASVFLVFRSRKVVFLEKGERETELLVRLFIQIFRCCVFCAFLSLVGVLRSQLVCVCFLKCGGG